MAANTTANLASVPRTLACRAICAAKLRMRQTAEPEKMGSFCPRTRVFSPSMAEMPVWMNSSG